MNKDLLYQIKYEISTSCKAWEEVKPILIEIVSENLTKYTILLKKLWKLDAFALWLADWIEKLWREWQEDKYKFALSVVGFNDNKDFNYFLTKLTP